MEVGTRVNVKIPKVRVDTYATGCAEQLNGKAGTIEDVRHHAYGPDLLLVRFDEPCKPWWTWQTPPTAVWFEPKDLEVRS